MFLKPKFNSINCSNIIRKHKNGNKNDIAFNDSLINFLQRCAHKRKIKLKNSFKNTA